MLIVTLNATIWFTSILAMRRGMSNYYHSPAFAGLIQMVITIQSLQTGQAAPEQTDLEIA
jgi:hypothetical protein